MEVTAPVVLTQPSKLWPVGVEVPRVAVTSQSRDVLVYDAMESFGKRFGMVPPREVQDT